MRKQPRLLVLLLIADVASVAQTAQPQVQYGTYRDAAGTITQINYPGALLTACLAINDSDEITGYYLDTSNEAHGFITKNGKFRTVLLPRHSGNQQRRNLRGFLHWQEARELRIYSDACFCRSCAMRPLQSPSGFRF